MSKLKQILTLFLGRGINTLANILFMPYLARSLSYEDYGTYGQVLLATGILTTVFSGGLATILFVFLADTTKQHKKILSSNVFIALIIGVISYVIISSTSGLVAKLFSNPEMRNYLYIYGLTTIFSIMNMSIGSALIYYKKANIYTMIITSTNLLKLILLLISIQIYHSLTMVFWMIVLVQFIQFVANYYFLNKRIIIKYIDFKNGIQQLKRGIALSVMGILGYLILYSDGLMVSHFLSVKEYAVYRNGAIEVPLIATLYASIAQIIFPKVTQLYANNEFSTIISLKRKIVDNSAAITYPIAVYLIIYSHEFIVSYLSIKYESSSVIFMAFTFTLLIRISDYLDVLIAAKKNKTILNIHLFAFVLNLVLNYILIHKIGNLGAAIATVISLYVYAFLFIYYTAKELKTNMISIFNIRKVLEILLISLLIMIPFFLVKKLSLSLISTILLSLFYFPTIYYVFIKYNYFDPLITSMIQNKTSKLWSIIKRN